MVYEDWPPLRRRVELHQELCLNGLHNMCYYANLDSIGMPTYLNFEFFLKSLFIFILAQLTIRVWDAAVLVLALSSADHT